MDRLPEIWGLTAEFGPEDSAAAQMSARDHAYLRPWCNRFSVVAPTAFQELLDLAEALPRPLVVFDAKTNRVIPTDPTSDALKRWCATYRLDRATWVLNIALGTVVVALTHGRPPSLVHSAVVGRSEYRPDGTARGVLIPAPEPLRVITRIEIPAQTIEWNPEAESPGEVRKRLQREIGAVFDQSVEKQNPVKVDLAWIDWAIANRVNDESAYSLGGSDVDQAKTVRRWIKRVNEVLFPNDQRIFNRRVAEKSRIHGLP